MSQGINDKRFLVPRDKILFWAFVSIALLPWLYFRLMQTLHPDILWLCEAMDRVFHGFTMSEAGYETTLPLSLLLYIIPVLLKNYVALPLHVTVPAQSFLILLAGTVMLYRSLRVFLSFKTLILC